MGIAHEREALYPENIDKEQTGAAVKNQGEKEQLSVLQIVLCNDGAQRTLLQPVNHALYI